jgi:hypothetical protein
VALYASVHITKKGNQMFYFKRNLPTWERVIRLAIGLCVAVMTATLAPALWIQAIGYGSAITLAGTALFGFCPACALFGRKAAGSSQ